MKAIYIKSKRVQQYSNGNIWGVVTCKNVATNQIIEVKGTLDRFPIAGDTLVIEDIQATKDRVNVFQSALIKVELPSEPHVLPKYLKLTGIANIMGFGEKKLHLLCNGPENVWELLAKDPNEWGEAYHSIAFDIRKQLHTNFISFKSKNAKADTDIPLLLTRIGVKMSKGSNCITLQILQV